MLGRWLLFIHVLSAITFFLAHGASAAMIFRIRKETNLDRIRAMLDLSGAPTMLYMISFVLLVLSGVVMTFQLRLWTKGWIWLSILLIAFVFFWMVRISEPYKQLRRLVGLPYMVGNKEQPAETPASNEEIAEHMSRLDVKPSVIVGYVLPAIVLWLMFFRPF
jgi:uncharacterized membrane protein